MQRVVGRVRAAVEVDRPIDRTQPLGMERDDLARDRIDFLRDAQLRGPTPDVVGRVRAALPFRQRLDRGVPRFGAQPRGVADRNAQIVAKFGTGHALGLVFPETRRPLTGEVHLRGRWCSEHRAHGNDKR